LVERRYLQIIINEQNLFKGNLGLFIYQLEKSNTDRKTAKVS
jgi:hypothetical protein